MSDACRIADTVSRPEVTDSSAVPIFKCSALYGLNVGIGPFVFFWKALPDVIDTANSLALYLVCTLFVLEVQSWTEMPTSGEPLIGKHCLPRVGRSRVSNRSDEAGN